MSSIKESKLFRISVRPVITYTLLIPEISPNTGTAERQWHSQWFPVLHGWIFQAVCHGSSFGQQLPFVQVPLLEYSFSEALQKKAVQLPASVLTDVDPCPVPLFHTPLLSGGVCGNRTYLAVCHGQAPGFIWKPTGTAFFDNVKPFFIRSSGMSFQSKSLQFKKDLERMLKQVPK